MKTATLGSTLLSDLEAITAGTFTLGMGAGTVYWALNGEPLTALGSGVFTAVSGYYTAKFGSEAIQKHKDRAFEQYIRKHKKNYNSQ